MRRRLSGDTLGALLIVVSASSFGANGPVSRFANEAGVTSLAFATWRSGVGALFVLAVLATLAAAGRRLWLPWSAIPRRDRIVISLVAPVNAALNLAMFVAFLRIGVALALLVFYVYPAYVAVASVLWFGDRLDRIRWAALAVSLAGVLLVVAGAGSLGSIDALGIGLALGAGLAQAFYSMSAQHGFRAVPGVQAAAITMGGATVVYLVAAAALGRLTDIAAPLGSLSALWPSAVGGLVGAGLPTMCFIAGIRLLGPPRAAILSTLEPVVAVTLTAILFGSVPTLVQVAGGILIIGAGIVLQLRPRVEITDHEAVADIVTTEEAR